MPAEVKVEQIKKAINMSIPLTIKTYTLPHDTEIYIDQVLEEFLKEIGHVDIYNAISYVVKELSVNAKKANTKRVYFTDENLDIDNGNDYESGMKDFKEKTLGNINHYLKLQKEAKLYIKVIFKAQDQELIVAIHNNVLITQKEQMRAYDRIARSRAFKSMEEAFGAVVDMSEGAGLGIVIMVLMLKKIGLSEEAFDLDVVNGETIAQVAIPFSEIHIEKVNLLAEAVVKEVNTLPQFPENLVYLQKLISDPEDDIQDIARQVATDAALVGDLLKLVNSAMYMLPRKVSRIADAVKLVGMRGLRNLLFSHGSQRILEKKYSEMETLWHHCETVALYANFLAKTYRQKADVLEDVYVGGILHDLGKIVVNALHPDLLDKIKKYCVEKGIPVKMLEDFSVGLNHPDVGAMIAAKWNFPEQLVETIRWHHEPINCPPEFSDLAFLVYFANCFAHYENQEISFDQIDSVVLEHFKIKTDEQFMQMMEKLIKHRETENE